MTVAAFVIRVQRILFITLIVNALAITFGTALVVVAAAALLNIPRSTGLIAGTGLSIFLVSLIAWRARGLKSVSRVALWLEELVPSLQYAVVTSVGNQSPSPALERSIQIDAIRPLVRNRITKVFSRSFVLLFIASGIYFLSPATSFGRDRVKAGFARAFPSVISPINKISKIRIQVFPPGYSGRPRLDQKDAGNLTVLAGSRVVLSGIGSAAGVVITVDDVPVRISGTDDEWSATLTATKVVSVVRARYMAQSRMVVIEATPDKAPTVTLTAPLRDTTLRTPRFSVVFRTEASDDIGLADGYFEYLVVSGSGESFSGRTVTSQPVSFRSRNGRMDAVLSFADLKITAGDIVSVRAVVRDNNSLTGPSIGTSDTRTFRVARADEYDSVSIEAAAPPPVDSSAMSQRMLIIMTEALVKKQKTLTRQQLVNESDDIASMEDRIRKRVYDILYQTDSPEGVSDVEEPESEIQAINNPDLKQAYDALWDAVRSLRIAEPAVALPPMRVALKALDRARLAQRLYLRGGAATVVVDIGRVRLTGKVKGGSSVRTTQSAADSARSALITNFESALETRSSDPRATMEELALLRARSLQSSPVFSNAIRDVMDALQQNRDAGPALLRARNALRGSLMIPPTTTDWTGG